MAGIISRHWNHVKLFMGHYTRHWGVLVLRGALDHAEEEEYTENHTARWRGAQYEIGPIRGLRPEFRKGQKA